VSVLGGGASGLLLKGDNCLDLAIVAEQHESLRVRILRAQWRSRLRYRRFVEEGLTREVQNPFEGVRWQAFLGDESFVQEVLDRVKAAEGGRGREVTAIRRAQREIDFQAVLEKVAKKYELDAKRLQQGERGLEARNVAMWLLWQTGSKSLREIGELFGGLDYAAVAQRIRRTRTAYPPRAAQKLLQEMLNV
jgi:hypothetical protein